MKAKVLKHSLFLNKSNSPIRIITFELELFRFILAQLLTHRMASKNTSSSRAITVAKMLKLILSSPAVPVFWGKNQKGMQAYEELSAVAKFFAKSLWFTAMYLMVAISYCMSKLGVHKQIANRLVEPFQRVKMVFTITNKDLAEFFKLRLEHDVQPEMQALARAIKEAYTKSLNDGEYDSLSKGMWHIPYVKTLIEGNLQTFRDTNTNKLLSLEEALIVSASCCAQVSYRLLDDSMEKASKLFHQLIYSKPIHASPFEHQVANVNISKGNLRGFKQLRHDNRMLDAIKGVLPNAS